MKLLCTASAGPTGLPGLGRRCFVRQLSGVTSGVLVAALGLCSAPAWADDALKLAQAVADRPVGRDATLVSRMELAERGRSPRVRELVTYRLDRGNGTSANLIRFTSPEDIEGTGLLGLTKADGSTEQLLYLPALDRARRVAGDRKGGRFVGSELYFEDLQERKPLKDKHRLLGKEALGGVPCEMLESVPIDAESSVYLRRVSWIDPASMLVLRVDYFEKDESRPSKRWLAQQRRRVNNIWTVTDSVMTDLASGRETRLIVQKVLYDRKLPESLFTARVLSDEQIEAEYRP